MDANFFLENFLNQFSDNTIGNYVVPGLNSIILGRQGDNTVRLFHMTRTQGMMITPHNHKYNSLHFVLRGKVTNTIYTKKEDRQCKDDLMDTVIQSGELGQYTQGRVNDPRSYERESHTLYDGGNYYLPSEVFHSIEFAKDTIVLVFEGPRISSTSKILVPNVNGQTCSTLFTADWMFTKNKDLS